MRVSKSLKPEQTLTHHFFAMEQAQWSRIRENQYWCEGDPSVKRALNKNLGQFYVWGIRKRIGVGKC